MWQAGNPSSRLGAEPGDSRLSSSFAVLTGRSAQSPKAWCPCSLTDVREQKYNFLLIREIVANSCAAVISEQMSASSERVGFFIPKPDLAREWRKCC